MVLRHRHLLLILLALAFVLRAAHGLTLDPLAAYADRGGDGGWYLANGYALVTGRQPSAFAVDVSTLSVAPGYLLFVGFWQAVLPPAAAVIAIRLAQAALGTLTCWLAYRLARRLTGSERAGLLAAGVLAVSPAFVIEPGVIGSETLYVALVAAALAVYTAATDRSTGERPWLAALALAGVLLGLATLTRAVLLLFPVGLAIHLLLVYPPRAALKRGLWLLLVYCLVVSTWTVYNWQRYNRFVVAAEGLPAFLYVGATGWDGPQGTDARLAEDAADAGVDPDSADRQQVYAEAAADVIGRDPAGYLQRRVSELVGAYLQPHGTVYYSGESLRALAGAWLRDDRSLAGLLALARADAFWPKLALYVFHYSGLAAGLAGMWLYRHRWRLALPMASFVLYTTLVHLVLLALPRYIFPTAVFWWVFAAAALVGLRAAADTYTAEAQPVESQP